MDQYNNNRNCIQDVLTNFVRIIFNKVNPTLNKFVQKPSVHDAYNNFKKTHFVFIANKFILMKLMMEKNGSCVNSVWGGFILYVLILIQNKILMLNFNALSVEKYKRCQMVEEIYPGQDMLKFRKRKIHSF